MHSIPRQGSDIHRYVLYSQLIVVSYIIDLILYSLLFSSNNQYNQFLTSIGQAVKIILERRRLGDAITNFYLKEE